MQEQKGKRNKRNCFSKPMDVAVGDSSHNTSKELLEQTEVTNSNYRTNHLPWNINQDNLKSENNNDMLLDNYTFQIQDKKNTLNEIRSWGGNSLDLYFQKELSLNLNDTVNEPNVTKNVRKRDATGNDEHGIEFLPDKTENDQQGESFSRSGSFAETSAKACAKKTGDTGTNLINQMDMEESKVHKRTQEAQSAPVLCARRKIRRKSKRSERRSNRAVKSIEEIKTFAEKLVAKVNELQHYLNENETEGHDRGKKRSATGAVRVSSTLSGAIAEEGSNISERCVPSRNVSFILSQSSDSEMANAPNRGRSEIKSKRVAKEKLRSMGRAKWKRRSAFGAPSVKPSTIERRDSKRAKRVRKWGRWTDWSSCSVTCGKGRQIRWRYCLHNCTIAETEMEEKACQLPSCPPGKFLGIF